MSEIKWMLVWSLLLFVLAGSARVSAISSTEKTLTAAMVTHRTNNVTEAGEVFHCMDSNITYGLVDICDQTAACPLNDDEFLCDGATSCYSNSFHLDAHCADHSKCIRVTLLCDGDEHCSDGSDELFCGAVTCGSSCSVCSAGAAVCDVRAETDARDLNLPVTLRLLNLTGLTSVDEGFPFRLRDLPHLTTLAIADSNISSYGRDTFENMTSLETLGISYTGLTHLLSDGFHGLRDLRYLDLRYNAITSLEDAAFTSLPNLTRLYLAHNFISEVRREHFVELSDLTKLDLSYNNLHTLTEGTFVYLTSLTSLALRGSGITVIEPETFRGLDAIGALSFTNNNIQELRVGTLVGLSSVAWLSLRQNPISYIEPGAFDNTTHIHTLLLEDAHLDNLEPDMFRGLTKLDRLSTDDYRLCCLFDSIDVCTAATQDSLDSCSRLMPNDILRYSLWILGSSALIGNSMVLFLRWFGRRQKNMAKQQPFFISNLAVADWMMGVFMLLIASADVYYGEYYYLYAPHWRSSHVCHFASFVATLSSESSVFMLTIITIDRYLTVVYPFSDARFTRKSARVCIGIMWFISITLSMVPVVVGSFVDGFYGLSDVCIGLPLTTDSTATGELVYDLSLGLTVFREIDAGSLQPSWIYSIFLFLGVNLLCFLVILVCYIRIFIQVRRMAKEISSAPGRADLARAQEVKIAIRMALIIGTDFLCWMPIIIMGLISQTGLVKLPVSLYAWATVFILPINASLNPYLYTFTAFLASRKRARSMSESSRSRTFTSTIGRQQSEVANTQF